MENYPLKQTLAKEAMKICQFPNCGKACHSFRTLENHISEQHLGPDNDSQAELQNHWVHGEVLRERRGAKQISHKEAKHVGLVTFEDGQAIDETKYWCKKCNQALLKRNIEKHMKQHDVSPGLVKTWLTTADGNKIHHAERRGQDVPEHRLDLTAALLDYEPGEANSQSEDEPVAGGDEGMEPWADQEEYGWAGDPSYSPPEGQGQGEADGSVELWADPQEPNQPGLQWHGYVEQGENELQPPEKVEGVHVEPDGTLWKPMWAQVDQWGQVKQPLNIYPLHSEAGLWGQEVGQGGVWSQGSEQQEQGLPPGVFARPTPKHQTRNIVPVASSSKFELAPSSNFGDMLQQVHGMLTNIVDPSRQSKWLEELPELKVKDTYLRHEGPPTKDRAGEGEEKGRGKDAPIGNPGHLPGPSRT